MQTEQGAHFQPVPNHNMNTQRPNVAEIVSVKEWLVTNLIMLIPLVNLIMMFVWAFGGSANPNKGNYFKASLIFALIVIILYILIAVVIIGAVASSFS